MDGNNILNFLKNRYITLKISTDYFQTRILNQVDHGDHNLLEGQINTTFHHQS